MSNHQKRLSAPDSWPVERKTATFTVKAQGPHGDDGVPLVVLLRDVLGYVDSTKEASYAVNERSVLVNGEAASDLRRPIGMFDILAFPARSEYYRVFPDEGGRLGLTPIDEAAADSKLAKVEDKTLVTGGRVQLNLHDGANLIVDDDEIRAGDSIVVDNEDGSVVAHFPYEEGALVTAVDGQHAGEVGTLASIDVTASSASNTVLVETAEGEFETIAEYVVVIDENFVEDEPTPDDDAEAEADDSEAEVEADEDADADADDSEAEADEDAEDAEDDAADADADADADDSEAEADEDDEDAEDDAADADADDEDDGGDD